MLDTVPSQKSMLGELTGKKGERPPLWFMRQAGRYLPEYRELRRQTPDFLTFCMSPEATVEAALQPLRRYAFDGAILFSDILVVPYGLGWDVSFVEGIGPVLRSIESERDLDILEPSRMVDQLAPVYESVRRLKSNLDAQTALIGFAGAPWTIAVYMVEGRGGTNFDRIRRLGYRDPPLLDRLMAVLVEATYGHLRAQILAGAEIIQIFDTWAGILPEPLFERWVIAPTAQLVRQLRREFPEVPVIGFPRGCGTLYLRYVEETGVSGVSIDAGVSLAWAAKVLQSKVTVQGNLDNVLLATGGEMLDREVTRILDGLTDGPHIFNLGHGILPDTPVENVASVVECVRNWRRR